MFPTSKIQIEFIVSFEAFSGIFWPDKSIALCGISKANFGLDQLEDPICSCTGTKLYFLLIATYIFQRSNEKELICLHIN